MTVTEAALPAVIEPGGADIQGRRAAGLTVMPALVPVIVPVTVSVAVTVREPAVFSV